MLRVLQVDMIKELQRKGMGPMEISERLGIDRKTVSKYMRLEDYNSIQPVNREHPSKLDRWKPIIDDWLEEDRKMCFKQRHTAKRVHDRLSP